MMRPPTWKLCHVVCWCCSVLAVLGASVRGAEGGTGSDVAAVAKSLAERIDAVVETSGSGPLSAVCSDAEFVRRVYLDLTGAVPSVAVTRAFLSDAAPNKREQLIDRLLTTPEFARNMAVQFDTFLMERRPDKSVKQDEWLQYLTTSFQQNKPWDQLAREILGADGTDERIRAAAKFYLDREGEPNLLTRDIGRAFFGMDLACCQCHDHPLVSTYRQADYYGLYAFLSRSSLFTNKDKKVFFAEKPEGEDKFTSVFTKQQDETRPCLPGDFEIAEPVLLKGDEYKVAPADNVLAIPKYSRREKLATLATSGANRAFNVNIANRVWAMMLGRGLVEPLDMHHLDNGATHPELLSLLAEELVKLKFDLRALVAAIVRTRTYQRSWDPPQELLPRATEVVQAIPQLEERLKSAAATWEKTQEEWKKVNQEYEGARKQLSAAIAAATAANGALGGAQKGAADAAKALAETEGQRKAKQEVVVNLTEASTAATAAAAQLASDAELMKAAEKIKARAAHYQGELTGLDKQFQERQAAAQKADAAVTSAREAATQAAAKIAAAQQPVTTIQGQLAALGNRATSEDRQVQALRSQLRLARTVEELAKLTAAEASARAEVSQVQGKIAAYQQALAQVPSRLSQLEADVATASRLQQESAGQLAECRSMVDKLKPLAQSLADAVAKAELALPKVPKDEELKSAVAAVTSRREKARTELEALQKMLTEREQAAKGAADQMAAAQASLTSARQSLDEAQRLLPEEQKKLGTSQAQLAAAQAAYQVGVERSLQQWTQHGRVGGLKPLTPEQLAWSILTVTGVVEQHRAAADAEVSKKVPPAPQDAAKTAERARLIEQQVYEKLKGNVATFVGLFGHASGQPQRDFFATVDQALFFANAGTLQGWLNPSGENLLGRLGKCTEPRQLAEELYLSVLSRHPANEEVAAVGQYLEPRSKDRPAALQELAWALITSNEFRFSH